MSKNASKHIIDTMGTAARVNRLKAANYFIQHPESLADLIVLVFDTSYKLHHKAAWVLEFVVEHHLEWILPHPHINEFTSNLSKLQNDSAIRPIAKICQWIAFNYVKKEDVLFRNTINKKHIDLIIEVGFDWMIGDYKVASKVYSMNTLYYFGNLPNKEFNWLHIELKNIILQHINRGSAAYKSAGKKILELL